MPRARHYGLVALCERLEPKRSGAICSVALRGGLSHMPWAFFSLERRLVSPLTPTCCRAKTKQFLLGRLRPRGMRGVREAAGSALWVRRSLRTIGAHKEWCNVSSCTYRRFRLRCLRRLPLIGPAVLFHRSRQSAAEQKSNNLCWGGSGPVSGSHETPLCRRLARMA